MQENRIMPMKTTDVFPHCGDEYAAGWFGSTCKAFSRAITAGAIGTAAAVTTTLCHSSYIFRDVTDIPTYCAGYIESERRGYQVTEAQFGFLNTYNFEEKKLEGILSYLFNYPNVQVFLAEMPNIIEKIYPGLGGKKNLQLITDPDTDELLLEFVFDSGLPVDTEFVEKEQKLFKEIHNAGIESGLVNVVFVNA